MNFNSLIAGLIGIVSGCLVLSFLYNLQGFQVLFEIVKGL